MELTPDRKGTIAELAIIHKADLLGIGVSRPMAEGMRYDLVFDWHLGLQRIQCKWATLLSGSVTFRPFSCRRSGAGQVTRTYEPSDVDAFAVYCFALDEVWVVPLADVCQTRLVTLRLAPAKNNQRSGVTLAEPYRLGAIAQLGERVTGSHEVGGSSPPGSTGREPPARAALAVPGRSRDGPAVRPKRPRGPARPGP